MVAEVVFIPCVFVLLDNPYKANAMSILNVYLFSVEQVHTDILGLQNNC